MKPYPRYRDSGVEWLGEIPEDWEVVPLKTLFRREKRTGHPEEEMLSVFRDHGVVPKSSKTNFNQTAESRDIYQLVDPGWLVLNRMKAWQGSVGVSRFRGIVSGHYICFRPTHEESSEYLDLLLRSRRYAHAFKGISRGVRPGQAEVDNDLVGSLPVLVPPPEIQQDIVSRLEPILSGIADLRRNIAQIVDDLNVRRSVVVRVAMAEGVKNVVPLSRIATKLRRSSVPGSAVVTAFRDGRILSRNERRLDGFTEAGSDVTYQEVRVGDLVFHGLDGFAGAVGVAESSGNCSPVCHVFSVNGAVDHRFVAEVLRELAVSGELAGLGANTRQRSVDFRSWSKFGSIEIAVPDAEMQRSVVSQVSSTVPLKTDCQKMIELLGERRDAAIAHAVFGVDRADIVV